MFEDSLFASRVAAGRSARRRWAATFAIAVQGAVAGTIFVVPLVWPEVLPTVSAAPRVTLALMKPEPKIDPPKPQTARVTNDRALRVQSTSPPAEVQSRRAGLLARSSEVASAADVPSLALGLGMGTVPGLGSALLGSGEGSSSRPIVVAPSRPRQALRVSTGVSTGLLLAPIRPVYPRIAIAARQEGTVVMTATIDKSGQIVGLQVVSGPEMLRSAALDAVKAARYRPYLLNGEATEVLTMVSVTFRMAG